MISPSLLPAPTSEHHSDRTEKIKREELELTRYSNVLRVLTISGGARWKLCATSEEIRGTCNLSSQCSLLLVASGIKFLAPGFGKIWFDLAQSWSSRAPQLDIIIGLREETQWLTETRRSRNLQNCEATKTQKFSSSWATNLTYV